MNSIRFVTCLGLAACWCLLSTIAALAEDATLTWGNGDSLAGELVGADASSIVWKSKLFTDPLKIRAAAISSVKFPETQKEVKPPKDLFRILMRNGNVLFGKLKAADADLLTFEGPRFGTFQLARAAVLGIQKSSGGGGILYSGPRGLEGWQPALRRSAEEKGGGPQVMFGLGAGAINGAPAKAEAESKVKPADMWTELPDGSIQSSKPDAALFLSQKLPDQYEVEFEVYSKKGLSFNLTFGRDTRNGLRIESWDNILVAARGTRFTTLMQIGDKEQSIHLHLFADRKTKKMLVFDHAGERLGEVELVTLRGLEGLTLRNGDGEISLKKLTIRTWDGTDPRISNGVETQIELADGSSKSGNLQSVNSDTGVITIEENGASVELQSEQLSSLSFPLASTKDFQNRGSAQMIWNDGSYISGDLQAVENGQLVLSTTYSKEPLKCQLQGALRLRLTPGPLEEVQTDRLFHAGKSLQGSLVVDGEANKPIQWKPLGGLTASTLKNGGDARFVRGSAVKHFSEIPEQGAFPDVLYLRNNDVIPCRYESMTETEVVLITPFSETRTYPKEKIRALEIGAAGRIHQRGFTDVGWKGIPAKQKDRDKLSFRGNNRYSHPSILTGDTVRFHLKWPLQSYGNVTMSLYGTGAPTDKVSTHVCFTIMQATLQITDEAPKPNNQFMFRGFNGQNPNELIRAPKGEVDVELVARDGKLFVSIDGKEVKSIKLNSAGAGMKGVTFNASVQNMGNVVINGQVQNAEGQSIDVTQFEIDNLAGASVRQFIQEELRQMALTVPRFRRDSPPTHVLIATNGDVLRGRMTEMTASHVHFESRLENVRLERERIAAVVWLDPPPKEPAAKLTRPSKKIADQTQADPAQPGIVVAPAPVDGLILETGEIVPAASNPPKSEENQTPADDQNAFVIEDESADGTMQAVLADGFTLTMVPVSLENGQIKGTSELLGNCTFPAATIRELLIGKPADRSYTSAYEQWIARHAPEPDWDISAADGGNSAASQMIGKRPEDFELVLLDGTKFRLTDHGDKIVVLDFWATWCGPCVAALPDYISATGHFDSSKVIFVAVNQQEAPDQIRRFLEEKQMAPIVALDRDGAIGQKFQVSGIPHTVIIGPGGTVEDVHVGYQAGAGEQMQISIQQMLDGTWKRPDPTAPSSDPPEAAKEPEGV